jgi:N,N'-diacetyllegionaminate synthase
MSKLFEAKPFIIAEVGSNWTNFNEAKDSISFAKQCGADAVKFQVFTEKDLFGPGIRGSWFDENSTQLPLDWLPKLKDKADACGIELMCSAFSPELYDAVDPYVKVHKIASSELTYPQLLQKVKSLGKPIILSTGASCNGDVALALQELRGVKVVLLYCSSAYPSREFNLFHLDALKRNFNVPVGFSDHSLDVYYPALSAVEHFGAVVIEKHVNFAGVDSADSPHSLSHSEFKRLCDILKGKQDYKQFHPQPEERDMILRHNRRLIAIKDISVGEAFRFGDNFGAYRSLENDNKGLIPFAWEVLVKSNGAKHNIKAGQPIGPEDFL